MVKEKEGEMREIKFKGWNIPTKIMIDLKACTQFVTDMGGLYLPTNDKKVILLQYTGLTDKNGKEIFEGDIVSQGDNYPSIIEWQCNPDEDEYIGWCLHEIYPKGENDRWHHVFAYTDGLGEIIGNIYENSEILEGK